MSLPLILPSKNSLLPFERLDFAIKSLNCWLALAPSSNRTILLLIGTPEISSTLTSTASDPNIDLEKVNGVPSNSLFKFDTVAISSPSTTNSSTTDGEVLMLPP